MERKNKIKTLEDCKVVQMDNTYLVTEEKLYRFSREGTPVLDIPHGSLIYTGNVKKGVHLPGGFPHAEFGIWKGKEKIEERKLIPIKAKNTN